MVRFLSLSSGSCGNCYFLSLEQEGKQPAGLIIDAGVSLRRMKKVLLGEGYSFDSFSDILVTHDHLDHIRHLGALCKHLGKPVHATPRLFEALLHHSFTSDWIGPCRADLEQNVWNEIIPGRAWARYFIVPHDATQTVGFALKLDEVKFVVMTDLGRMTEEALNFARQADVLVIESNYDRQMLLNGTYTQELKMRICHARGHLSNEDCAEAIKTAWHPGLRHIFLCHLSENNNTPELAFDCSARALKSIGFEPTYERSSLFFREDQSVSLHTLPRHVPSTIFNL